MRGRSFHRCALITGASAGLGAEFARQLAPRCGTLVLVARRGGRLEELAGELREAHPDLKVAVITADLTGLADRDLVVSKLSEAGWVPDLLVNNAGMGDYGDFADAEWPKIDAMLKLNVEALTHLTHALVPGMTRSGGGAVLNVSSLASLLPIPDFAVYAATKAYVTSFSEALRIELRGHGITVSALCPGLVHTEFGQVAQRGGAGREVPMREWFYIDQKRVVAGALRGLVMGKARVFPGLRIALAAAVISALPVLAIRLAMGFRPRR